MYIYIKNIYEGLRMSTNMKMITLFVPGKYLEAIEGLISSDHFPNRSEAIRTAIRDLIIKEYVLKEKLEFSKEIKNKIKNLDE
jgi:Arc/MetJ-type ribon-helix-helix transcriptional regulator